MILTKLEYSQHKNHNTFWEIKDLNFDMFNIIIGLNSTGKTRLLNIISNFAKIISKKIPNLRDGTWDLEFRKNEKEKYKYKLEISGGKVLHEEIISGRSTLLKREEEKGQIYSRGKEKKIRISPPVTELTLHVRRDIKEHPFLEDLHDWANNVLGYKFTSARPDEILIPVDKNQRDILENLGATPYILEKALNDTKIIRSIINDFSLIGYPVNKVNVKSTVVPNLPHPALLAIVKEKNLLCETDQTIMSQGMFRAFSLIVIIEYLLKNNKQCTVLIDDVGEGLDFERSSALTKLLIRKVKNSRIQLIVTSNDRFLINAVDIKYLNVLERIGHVVKAYNYDNSKKLFKEFEITGLNSFDLLSGQMYKNSEAEND